MYEYHAKITRWIDADTILVSVDLGFSCAREERIRLARINAWEMNDDSSYKRRWSRHARTQAKRLFPEASWVVIQTKKNPKKDMYARYIAEVFHHGTNISDALLEFKGVEEFRK